MTQQSRPYYRKYFRWVFNFFRSLAPAALFSSGILAFLTPFALMKLLAVRNVWLRVFLVALNFALLAIIGGVLNSVLMLILAFVPLIVMRSFLHYEWAQKDFERLLISSVFIQVLTTVVFIAGWWALAKVGWISSGPSQVWLEFWAEIQTKIRESGAAGSADSSTELAVEQWIDEVRLEFAPTVAVLAGLIQLSTLLALLTRGSILRWTVALRQRFLTWKISQIYLWPMIICGAGVLFTDSETLYGQAAYFGFRVLSAVYSLHGLAIASVWMDRVGLFGLIRTLAMALLLLPLAPALLAIGFFDQWFDIRAKFMQN